MCPPKAFDSLTRSANAERCFPSHSPTLRPWIVTRRLRTSAAVAVLRGGALEPEPRTFDPKISKLKHTLIYQRHFQRRAPRVFLSQAGPRFDLGLFQAEHHLWFRRWLSPPETKKATQLGRPRLARYAAKELARIPPSEGQDVAGLALRIEAVPARQAGDGGRRFGKERSGVDCDHHFAAPDHRRKIGHAQAFQTKI